MSSRIDVVIDLETLGTAVDSVIVQIGAVATTGDEFTTFVDAQGPMNSKRRTSLDTVINFWGQQVSPDTAQRMVRMCTKEKAPDLALALHELTRWLYKIAPDNSQLCIWGNGASFDLGMLTHAYQQCVQAGLLDSPQYWNFWMERDLRTLVDCAWQVATARGEPGPSKAYPLEPHDALSDALAEMMVLRECTYILKKLSSADDHVPEHLKSLQR